MGDLPSLSQAAGLSSSGSVHIFFRQKIEAVNYLPTREDTEFFPSLLNITEKASSQSLLSWQGQDWLVALWVAPLTHDLK